MPTNEPDWLICADPVPMLAFLSGRASSRQLRLFACACCRRLWHLLPKPRSQNSVQAAERFADGHLSHQQLLTA